MKHLIGICFIVSLAFSSHGQNNPVIVELYTSQGCSSCPAADKNLTEILKKAEAEGLPVYGLSFHVDYWNYIGWKDPYSNKEFTERQKMYSSIFHSNGIYTPQMVVNGSHDFVGSNKSEAAQSIHDALTQKATYQLTLSNLERSKGKLNFNFEVDADTREESLCIAIVERSLENYVSDGENNGMKLHHDNVVRTFMTMNLQKKGTAQVDLPKEGKRLSLIAFVQNWNGKILAAAASPLPE